MMQNPLEVDVETPRSPAWTHATVMGREHWLALTLAILIVLVMRMGTPIAKPMTDGVEYLKVASLGLKPEAQLGAPFVYRFAVPLLVHSVSLATGADPLAIFPVVVFITSVVLLMAVYTVALMSGATRGQSLLILLLLASALFMIRFPLYSPFEVDVEACAISFFAFACLIRRSYMAALVVSLVGLLFKEFLLAPLLVLIGVFLGEYHRTKAVAPLRWAVISLALTLIVFLLPRLLIPVTYSYGAILRLKSAEPSQSMYLSELRALLAWPPKIGTPVNVFLALISFWLPAVMLMTRTRCRALWQGLGSNRTLVILWLIVVVVLMAVGGTKTFIFATYSAPVLVLVLGLLVNDGVRKGELAVALIGTILFNRMIFGFGTPGGEPGADIAFYGAYWNTITDVTAWRFAEVSGWLLVGWATRRFLRAQSQSIEVGERV